MRSRAAERAIFLHREAVPPLAKRAQDARCLYNPLQSAQRGVGGHRHSKGIRYKLRSMRGIGTARAKASSTPLTPPKSAISSPLPFLPPLRAPHLSTVQPSAVRAISSLLTAKPPEVQPSRGACEFSTTACGARSAELAGGTQKKESVTSCGACAVTARRQPRPPTAQSSIFNFPSPLPFRCFSPPSSYFCGG